MTPLARALSLALLLLASTASAQAPFLSALTPGTPVELRSERLSRDADGTVRAEGAVQLRAGALHLFAPTLTYDPANGELRAEDGVTLVEGVYAVRARRVFLDLDERTGVMSEATVVEKRAPLDPKKALAAERLETLGTNRLVVVADEVVRIADGSFVASGASVTTCDCGDEPPSWRIHTGRAKLIPGETVNLRWPVFRVRDVPVLALPFWSIPLEDRKTGLLAPSIGLWSRRGPSIEQPLFLVLGRSYDATITAGYFAGSTSGASYEGPKQSLELRYRPRLGTEGRAFFAYARDSSGRTGLPKDRGAFELSHRDDWGAGLSDRIELRLLGDRAYYFDFTDDVVLRDDQTMRSTAWIAKRTGPLLASVSGTYLQDLRSGGSVRLFGSQARPTLQRLPAAGLDVARLALPNAAVSLQLGAVRFAPFGRSTGDEGLDGRGPGAPGYLGPDVGEGDRIFQPGERAAATRFALRSQVDFPLRAGRFLAVTPYAGVREQLYLYDPGTTGRAGLALFGANVSSELSRAYGDLRHVIAPRFELRRVIVTDAHDAPNRPYDELDLGAPFDVTAGVLELASSLRANRKRLELVLAQELELRPVARARESVARVGIGLEPLRASALVRVDPARGVVTQSGAYATLRHPKGHELRSSYVQVADGGSTWLRAAPDLLFDPRDPAPGLRAVEQLSAGVSAVPIAGLTLRYDVLLLLTRARLLQQTAGLAYRSACDCWGVRVDLALRPGQPVPDAFLSADLGDLARL